MSELSVAGAAPSKPVSGLPGPDAPELRKGGRVPGLAPRRTRLPLCGKGRRLAARKAAASQPGRNPQGWRSARGAHTWTWLRSRLLSALCSHHLRSRGRSRGDQMDPSAEVLG